MAFLGMSVLLEEESQGLDTALLITNMDNKQKVGLIFL